MANLTNNINLKIGKPNIIGGDAIVVSENKINVKYDNKTIKLNNDGELMADFAYGVGKDGGLLIGGDECSLSYRGPSEEGFHVPTTEELNTLVSIIGNLSGGVADRKAGNFFFLPMGGRADAPDGARENDRAAYWSCQKTGTYQAWACAIRAEGHSVKGESWKTATGISIREYRDTPVVPDDSWITIAQEGLFGIYRNQEEGLISYTVSNGNKRFTMKDKNLGATTVYHWGDEMSQNNCGNIFQRGNNYPFPRGGEIDNLSTEQVDTSMYGPRKYYSSDVFALSVGSRDWSSVDNRDLWGGVTQGYYCSQQTLKVDDQYIINLVKKAFNL